MVPADPPGGIRGGRPRLGGHGFTPRAQAQTDVAKKRVLFVCLGNSCRSQMAEAFARAYGSDVFDVHSAGLTPAPMIAPLTKQVLNEKNLRLDGQFPKSVETISREPFDIVVNMSGIKVAIPGARMIDWQVRDPIGLEEEVYRAVASEIEALVMRLILEVRLAK
jgi:arsenate reductase (thioredoxin)